jgi:chemotaxis protein methyltransferase CheR
VQVNGKEIPLVAEMVKKLCGIILDDSKGYLIESRLSTLATAAGCGSFTEFCQKAERSTDPALRNKIIDAITTQETLFFRDASPFEALQHKVLPELIDSKAGSMFPRRLRIWSAASSTGQEVYSIAMTLHELLGDVSKWNIKILGTDISDSAVKQASLGRYAKHEIQRGVKPEILQKYFVERNGCWQVKDELRFIASFQKRNLLQPFADLETFDIIFCRNVAIYFDSPTKRDLFHRLSNQLIPNGYLFVGSSESLADLGPQYTPKYHCRGVFYQPKLTGNGATNIPANGRTVFKGEILAQPGYVHPNNTKGPLSLVTA